MSTGYRIVASTGLDRGDRPYQQDQLCLLSHPRVPGCVLGVVADGMGGRSGGRKASDQVMLTAKQLFDRFHPETESAPTFLRQLASESHLVIKLTAVSAEEEPHSTVAAFLLLPNGACHWLHAGDSRVYHFHRDRLVNRTKDHSFVQTLVERGQLTEEEAQFDPRSNILLGCLGSEQDPPVTLHEIERMNAGDCLMACSDGLWHYFTTDELARTLDLLSPREACEFLIQKAKVRAQGGGDNISIVVVKFEALAPQVNKVGTTTMR
jgi:serine/threonine protein phosphatase PrpC